MMHQHQIMSTVSVDGRIKELEAKIKESDNRNKSTHDDATRRMNLFQEHGNQLSTKVDIAMQGIIAVQHSIGEMENKATTKSEGGFKKGIMDHKVIQNLNPLTGDKSKFRQWHQKLMKAMCQVKKEYG